MKSFDARAVLQAMAILERLVSKVEAGVFGGPSTRLVSDRADAMNHWLDTLEHGLAPLNAPVTKAVLSDARSILRECEKHGLTVHQCAQMLLNVSHTLGHELAAIKMFVLDARHADLYSQTRPLFGSKVEDAYPSAEYDIAEAGRALAAGLSTACVMHAIRALEIPMGLLFTELTGSAPNQAAWGALLNTAREKVNLLPASDPRKDVLSEAVAHLRAVKNAWRDVVMHARSRYTESQALDILMACKATMQSLAPILQE